MFQLCRLNLGKLLFCKGDGHKYWLQVILCLICLLSTQWTNSNSLTVCILFDSGDRWYKHHDYHETLIGKLPRCRLLHVSNVGHRCFDRGWSAHRLCLDLRNGHSKSGPTAHILTVFLQQKYYTRIQCYVSVSLVHRHVIGKAVNIRCFGCSVVQPRAKKLTSTQYSMITLVRPLAPAFIRTTARARTLHAMTM